MAYASLSDMITRFGEIELVRLTTPEGEPAQGVVGARIVQVLDDASSLIDSNLRRHYVVPIVNPPNELIDVCCQLARYALHVGPNVAPNEQVRTQRKEALAWLKSINDGQATLDGVVAPNTDRSFARVQDRRRRDRYVL